MNNLGNAVEIVVQGGGHAGETALLAREEAVTVFAAAGIEPADVRFGGGMRPVGGRPRLGGSTFQSLHRRAGSVEVDYLNGEIVLLGRRHGVPTPVNALLQRLANQMAREKLAPGLMTAEEFAAALAAS
jgi:2-dehydropantoate 2-reductase